MHICVDRHACCVPIDRRPSPIRRVHLFTRIHPTHHPLHQDADVIIDERYSAGVLTLEQALAAYGLTETDTAYKAIAGKKWFRQDKTGSASGASVGWVVTVVCLCWSAITYPLSVVIHPLITDTITN